ncbi:mRNA decay activator protein ZFP36-like [Trifolium pratense]|uniref:Uncharacterized protein n=2 Tax=Trifolium pratense TaxID=57577 RepID=A0ACB0KXF8_TRIPR|nr:mRNA decay activator protein ZFP36-like [Trifolium pratense]CAJ2661325.1 unnamed protein product [Trifolium pratense]
MEAERYSAKFKTQLCIKFMQGTCAHGANCNYAHGYSEIRETPRLCRMFSSNRHCNFGNNCRFIHSTPHHHDSAIINITPQQQQGTVQNAGCRTMQTAGPPAAINFGSSSAQNKMVQTSTVPATNDPASSSTVPTTKLHKNGPYAGISKFDKTVMQKVIGKYADWI